MKRKGTNSGANKIEDENENEDERAWAKDRGPYDKVID